MEKKELKIIGNLYKCPNPECGFEKDFSKYEIEWSLFLDEQWGSKRPKILACEKCGEIMKPVDET